LLTAFGTQHVKPIISAIQGSKELSLQPQQDAQNACQLNIPIPPPTKESRDQALVAANKAGETASAVIRNARGAMQKKLRAIELKKAARPDDLKKAHKEMEKIAEKGNADVKKAVDAAKKMMEYS
jgi:ribosome recycling factor